MNGIAGLASSNSVMNEAPRAGWALRGFTNEDRRLRTAASDFIAADGTGETDDGDEQSINHVHVGKS